MRRITRLVLVCTLAFGAIACAKKPPSAGSQARAPQVAAAGGDGAESPSPQALAPNVGGPSAMPAKTGASSAAEDRVIGAGHVFGNLVVYPITSRSQVDVGALVTLDDALAKGDAVVRETDASGRVNTLVIENKGATPVFVLAGTIVKGGKQDRQIGQDFIIGGKETTPVDAFCVEHGRWNASRDGQATGNVFRTSDTLTTSKVRAAGQYKKDQGEVWSKVSESNATHKKAPASDTYLATVDDVEVTRQRTDLAAKIVGALDAVSPNDQVVGVAYAIDGQPRGARWFTHHKVFTMVEKKLASGIALEAITAKGEAEARGDRSGPKPAPSPAQVDAFIKDVQAQAVKERRDTAGQNVNDYRESDKGYGSSTMMKASSKAGAPPAAAKPVSVDVLSK
jgi:hypothetical protein